MSPELTQPQIVKGSGVISCSMFVEKRHKTPRKLIYTHHQVSMNKNLVIFLKFHLGYIHFQVGEKFVHKELRS